VNESHLSPASFSASRYNEFHPCRGVLDYDTE